MLTKTRNYQAGSAHIVLIVGAVLLLVTAIGWFTYNKLQYTQKVNKERALYAAADKEAKAYIDAIAEKYPGEVKNYRYCDYSSEIYSKGSLGCTVETSLIVTTSSVKDNQILAFSDKKQKNIGWLFAYDNTKSILETGNSTLIKILVYKKGDITCRVRYGHYSSDGIIDKNKIEINAGCSGNALAEYYPVVER